MNAALEIQNLSKHFRLNTEARTLFRLIKRISTRKHCYKELWALKDITFAAKKGERIGLIGDNGSGKTTLLRILAGVYKQTSGTVKVTGQMSGFLALGAGMQRDLSTLDNIYLFAAIIGVRRSQIRKKTNAILDFAGLTDFVHSPLRDFSTGMIQRLAMSIIKEVNSEIVFFDEALLAGDVSFVKKCYGVYESYKGSGKTLIMSSHNMDTIEKFCSKTLLLHEGKQVAFGPTKDIVDIYKSRNF